MEGRTTRLTGLDTIGEVVAEVASTKEEFVSINLEWRGYIVIAGVVAGVPAAQVYLGKKRATAERFGGSTVEAAIEAARAWIDERLAARFAQRRAAHVATAADYADYFAAHPLRPHERLMLAAHVEAQVMTATELAAAAGWDSYSPANLHYGWLACEIAKSLGLEVPSDGATGNPVWTYALAEADPPSPEGHFRWRIHPELAEGLALSGVLGP